jgi:hypothetical protein
LKLLLTLVTEHRGTLLFEIATVLLRTAAGVFKEENQTEVEITIYLLKASDR